MTQPGGSSTGKYERVCHSSGWRLRGIYASRYYTRSLTCNDSDKNPFRVTLGGGGTDRPSYYREHSGFDVGVVAAADHRKKG